MRLSLPETIDVVAFRAARVDDIDGLVSLFQHFFAESTLPSLRLRFDPARMRAWLENAIGTGRVPHIVALDSESGQVVGSIAYTLNHQYTDRPMAELDKFYVLREWRGSAIGHTLLSLAIQTAQGDGAAAFRAGISSGINGGQNLFAKFGFHETPHSILLVKEL